VEWSQTRKCSVTGRCVDLGVTTSRSLAGFQQRESTFSSANNSDAWFSSSAPRSAGKHVMCAVALVERRARRYQELRSQSADSLATGPSSSERWEAMPALSISIPHQFDRNAARQRTQEWIGQFQQQYGGTLGHLDQRWNGDTMNFTFIALGLPISGQAHVEDRTVRLDIELPWLLSKLAGGMRHAIEQHGRKLLDSR
jgi:hypothetical protein